VTRITLQVTPVRAGSGEPIAESERIDCPLDVAPDTLLSFLTERFGEPTEVALTATEKNPRIAIGWFFRQLNTATRASDGVELMIIPFISLEDGSSVAMFLHQAEQLECFEALAKDQHLDLTVIDQPQRDYKPQQ